MIPNDSSLIAAQLRLFLNQLCVIVRGLPPREPVDLTTPFQVARVFGLLSPAVPQQLIADKSERKNHFGSLISAFLSRVLSSRI